MKKEDVKIGDKVIPFQKTAYFDNYSKNTFKNYLSDHDYRTPVKCYENKGYCIVSRFDKKENAFVLSDSIDGEGDYFNASDFTPYKEPTKKIRFSGYFEGNKTVFTTNTADGEANYNPNDETPYNPVKGLLYAYCRATDTDTAFIELLFKKPVEPKEDKPTLRDEVVRLLKSSEFIIPAVKYYREKMNCNLLEAKNYVDKIRAEIQPTTHTVLIDGVKYVKVED